MEWTNIWVGWGAFALGLLTGWILRRAFVKAQTLANKEEIAQLVKKSHRSGYLNCIRDYMDSETVKRGRGEVNVVTMYTELQHKFRLRHDSNQN